MLFHRSKKPLASFTLAAIGFSLCTALAAPLAGAQTQQCITVGFQGYRLIDPGVPISANSAVALPAGTVSITNALSSDSYPERINVTQSSERWDIQFLDAGGQVIATSAPTEDLADQTVSAVWQGSLGSVQLATDAAYVRAHHRPDLSPDNSKNSVDPIEATFCWTEAPPTTTAAPTTTAPATTAAPATTETPPTTSAPD
ncbi:MAG: hypothetical protein HKN26_12235, partial [Acidimicrobiales bacterium]|nr:hypothetical protein [Acidimicrobiales bacterium]